MELRLLPVRCFSCNKILQSGWEDFRARVRSGVDAEQALDDAGFARLCCRRMLLTQPTPLDASEAGKADESQPAAAAAAAASLRTATKSRKGLKRACPPPSEPSCS